MENTYWNRNGKFQKEYDRLSDELVPAVGKCETLGGELLRASGRIYYEAYNNSFCNNSSGALNFLVHHFGERHETLKEAFELLEGKVNTDSYSSVCPKTEESLELLADMTIRWVLDNPEAAQAETVDMFDFQEETFREEEDEDEYEEYEDEYDDEDY